MSEDAQVTVRNNPAERRYEAVDGSGTVTGFAEYQLRRDGTVVFTHTEVDDLYEGQGVGSTLAQTALDDVRASGTPVVVRCPFLRAWIGRHPDYQDLLS
ncbi:MAG: GNAT family N-acetyltransferase [Nocardioidaceae bacterium]